MKKTIILTLIYTLLILPTASWGTPPDFSGAIHDEYIYEEIVFITGRPIKFVGTFSISETERDGKKTVTYKLSRFTPEDRSIEASINRTIRYVTTYTKRNDKGQTTAQTTVERFSETIEIGDDEYRLVDYQFSKSDIIDNRPASDYYSGNITGRKIYAINDDEGTVTMNMSGGNVGYENFWGNTETQLIDYDITYDRAANEDEDAEAVYWQGTVNIQTSDSMTKTLRYFDNDASFTSFYGGYLRTTNREMVSKYDYNLPRFDEEGQLTNRRNRGTVQLNLKMVPRLERLIVQKFRDIQGHWAEEAIAKLYSLDIFEEESTFFLPNIPLTRIEFTKAIIKACNIRTSLEPVKPAPRRRNQPPEVSPFTDLAVDHSSYAYVKDALDKRIITGVSADLFKPDDPLTRAQAISIMIRALGFESKAPNPGYYTSFADDSRIPDWAKDSIYVAQEINLIAGDDFNRVNPNQVVTRAEASSMLIRFLEFLERDLQKDYRENIINFR